MMGKDQQGWDPPDSKVLKNCPIRLNSWPGHNGNIWLVVATNPLPINAHLWPVRGGGIVSAEYLAGWGFTAVWFSIARDDGQAFWAFSKNLAGQHLTKSTGSVESDSKAIKWLPDTGEQQIVLGQPSNKICR